MKRLPSHNIEPSATNGDVLTTVGGKATWAAGASGAFALVPLISVTGGVPSLVFDDDNQLVMTEVPL